MTPTAKPTLRAFFRHQLGIVGFAVDLIVIFDDANSEAYYAQLVPEESTLTVMAGLKTVVQQQGVFCRCMWIEAATLSPHRWPAERSIVSSRPRLAGLWSNWAAN